MMRQTGLKLLLAVVGCAMCASSAHAVMVMDFDEIALQGAGAMNLADFDDQYMGFDWTGDWTVVSDGANVVANSSGTAAGIASPPFRLNKVRLAAADGAASMTIRGYLGGALTNEITLALSDSFATVTPALGLVDAVTFDASGAWLADDFEIASGPDLNFSTIPEPITLVALTAGACGLVRYTRRRATK